MTLPAEYRYAGHVDLVYHLLAHMQVNNASDLFDTAYIQKMAALRAERSSERDVRKAMQKLVGYYNQHFERLGVINFLPVYACGFEEMKEGLRQYDGFTPQDAEAFLLPFLDLMDEEALFYFPYWEERFAINTEKRAGAESRLQTRLEAFSPLFAYCHKSPVIYFSDSITRNGRGIGGLDSTLCAVVPFPQQEKDDDHTFFTLLHEYTHQLTDSLLQTDIHMDDSSHDMAENAVMLFDYHLIAALQKSLLPVYFGWIAALSGHEGEVLSETAFLSLFPVENRELQRRMHTLLQEIVQGEHLDK